MTVSTKESEVNRHAQSSTPEHFGYPRRARPCVPCFVWMNLEPGSLLDANDAWVEQQMGIGPFWEAA